MGGKGGKGGSSGSVSIPNLNIKPSPYEESMANISNQYYQQTSPVRGYFLEDWANFMRPSSSGTYTTGGTGTSTSTAGTSGVTSAPMSANFKVPNKQEIIDNLKKAYKYNDANAFTDAANYLSTNFNEGIGGELVGGAPAFMVNGQYNPELDTWINNRANTLWQSAMEKSMNQAQAAASTPAPVVQTTQPSAPGPAGFTNQNLYNPYNLPGYAPLYQLARGGIESQYGQARSNILSSLPRGGSLYEGLANLEMGRAQEAGALPASIAAPLIQDIMNKAYGAVFAAPQTSISGLSAANQGYSGRYNTSQQIAAQSAMQQNALNQQAGLASAAGIGSLIGLGIKGATK